MEDPILGIFCLIALIILLCQWVSWWSQLPAILFLLTAGIILGPVLGWLHPQKAFGELLSPIISLSVAVILFEGSLTLKRKEFSDVQHVVRNLISIGILITAGLTAVIVHYLFKMNWGFSILLGMITGVTGPTVIVPMLRTIRPRKRIANILRWEGIAIDPIGAILAILVYGIISALTNEDTIRGPIIDFLLLLVVGGVLGVGAGFLFAMVLKRHWLPEYLHNITTLSLVLVVYGLGSFINDGGGLLAVTVMGVVLTNIEGVPIDEIFGFKESLSIILISGLFIIISAQLKVQYLESLLLPGLILCLLLQFVVRPLNIFICSLGSGLNWKEKVLLSWISPRGIVAAAVAAIMTLKLQSVSHADSKILFSLTFIIIIFTVVFQGVTARFVAKLLGLAEPVGRGFLIVGANPVARAIARALVENDFTVMLTTRRWDYARAARMENFPVYFGDPISEHAARNLELVGIDGLMAITVEPDLNALSCVRYKNEFGAKSVYTIRNELTDDITDPTRKALNPGQMLFGTEVTFRKMKELLAKGAKIRTTHITENYTFERFMQDPNHMVLPLFAIDPKSKLYVYVPDGDVTPVDGWSVISLSV